MGARMDRSYPGFRKEALPLTDMILRKLDASPTVKIASAVVIAMGLGGGIYVLTGHETLPVRFLIWCLGCCNR